MRGGLIFALDEGLFERAAAALETIGARTVANPKMGGVAQLQDEAGRLFTLFDIDPEGIDIAYSEDPFLWADGVAPMDLESVVTCPFECRWPDLAARCLAVIAEHSTLSTWVLDSQDKVWDAHSIDPQGLEL